MRKVMLMAGILLLLAATVAVASGVSEANQSSAPVSPAVAPDVNLDQYMGAWYEIARIPVSFQKECVGNARTEYSMLSSGRLRVLNICQVRDGEWKTLSGRAKVNGSETSAKLEVTFVRLFGWWAFPLALDYWIIALDDDYRYAVVGHPDRKYGWILSRTPSLAGAALHQLADILRDQGYDPCRFLVTPQEGGLNRRQPFCKIAG